MDRFIEVTLRKRGVSCIARLLDDLAPRTCEAMWNALPQEGDAFHAKYASNEVYTLVPSFAPSEPGMENPTVTPITGDLLYFFFPPGAVNVPSLHEAAFSTGL
ncbi:MAG: DUF3830 family protein, partial [Gemmatimonadota bacterium]|nr:DUF3830 family protein [Gemmatimonadota bacterium]